MNIPELQRALRQLRARRHRGRAGNASAPGPGRTHGADLIACLISYELTRPLGPLAGAPPKAGGLSRSPQDTGQFRLHLQSENKPSLVFDPAMPWFYWPRDDALFRGPRGDREAVSRAGHWSSRHSGGRSRAPYREAPRAVEDLPRPSCSGSRKRHAESRQLCATIIDYFWNAETAPHRRQDLLEIIMRRYERASTLLSTSNCPVQPSGK